MSPEAKLKKIKGECLAKYAERKPKVFYQIDCFGPAAAGDCVIDPRGTGRGMMSLATWELMQGTPVRILIDDTYDDPELVADMLIEAAKWVRETDLASQTREHMNSLRDDDCDEMLPI